MSTWKEYTVADIVSTVIDYRGKTPKKLGGDWSDSGYRALSAKNIKTGKIVQPDSIRCVSEDMYKAWMKEEIQREDILITSEAPFGQIYFWNSDEKIVLSQRLFAIRVNGQFYPKYIYFYMTSSFFQAELDGRATGTTVVGLRQPELLKCKVLAPSYEEQRVIAETLWCLEQKINHNEEINNNLEQQAKALYKDWFFDFSPFSTDGNLPKGWRVGTVGDIIQFHDSKRVPLSGAERDKIEKIYPYYGATTLMDYVDNYLFDGIYLLLGEDGTVVNSLGFPILQYVYGQFWVNNHAHIITGKEGFSVEELYLFFNLTNIKSIVTGAVQQKVSQKNLKKVKAIIPNKEVLSAFDDLIQPIFAQIRNLRDENARLADLRDILLPRLMSGELDVSEIDL
jgi:hypothetical protein